MLSQLTDMIVNGLLLAIVLGSDLGAVRPVRPVRPGHRPVERMDFR